MDEVLCRGEDSLKGIGKGKLSFFLFFCFRFAPCSSSSSQLSLRSAGTPLRGVLDRFLLATQPLVVGLSLVQLKSVKNISQVSHLITACRMSVFSAKIANSNIVGCVNTQPLGLNANNS